MTASTPEDAPMLLPHALAARVLRSASVTNAGFFQGTGMVNSGIVAPRKGGGDRRQGGRSKILRKSDGDYRLGGVPWPNIENQGLVFFCCGLDVKDHFKGNVRAAGFRSPRGERCDPKHVPQRAFNVRVGVFLRDRLIAAIRSLVAATGKRKLASAAVGVTSISARRDKFRGIAVCV
jgi:hypothetical protein